MALGHAMASQNSGFLIEVTDPWGGRLASAPVSCLFTGETEQKILIVWDIRYHGEFQEHLRVRYRDTLWQKVFVKMRELGCKAIFCFDTSHMEMPRMYPPRVVTETSHPIVR
ncbi:MAG: hypothetical protein HY457_03525 [Parcubacteria group bacterium]|nr:hypothetical protein [Parcubacteria group bacterium]